MSIFFIDFKVVPDLIQERPGGVLDDKSSGSVYRATRGSEAFLVLFGSTRGPAKMDSRL